MTLHIRNEFNGFFKQQTADMQFLTRLFKAHFAWLILTLGLLLSLSIAWTVKKSIERDAAHRFEFAAAEVTLKIEERLQAYALILQSGVAFFNGSSDIVDRDQWRVFVDTLREHPSVSGIQGIGFSKVIHTEDLQEHIDSVRADGFPDYTVYPAGERPFYTSIVYLEPLDWRNMRAIGFDMFSEPVRRTAMEKARDTGKASLSGKVELVQEVDTDIQAGTLMYVPVYRQGDVIDSVEARRSALLGWVYSPYRMKDLMSQVFIDWTTIEDKVLGLRVYDGKDENPEHLLFTNYSSLDDLKQSSIFNQNITLNFNGTDWLLVFDAKAASANISYLSAWAVLFSGFALSGLLCGLMLSLNTTRQRANLIADNLTQEIQKRESLLKESEFRWRFAIEGAGDGLWDWNLADGKVFFSSRLKDMLGYSADEISSNFDEWRSRVHSKDLKQTMSEIQAHLDGNTELYRHEYRLKCKDGSWKWVFARGVVVERDADHKPLRMIGTHSDITSRKETDEKLQLAASVFSHAGEGVMITDTSGHIIDVNEAFTHITGFGVEEVIGKNSRILSSGRHDKEFYASIWNSLKLKGFWHGEIWNRRKTGEVYAEILTISAVNDEDGAARHYVAIFSDITSVKEYQTRLESIAHYDVLTRLPNRVLLSDRLHQAIAQVKRNRKMLAVAFIDLDGFKAVNDNHGHQIGDELLIAIASRLKAAIREGDTIARIGGDEFIVAMVDLGFREECYPMLDRLLSVVSKPVKIGEFMLQVSASIGVTFYPQEDNLDADQLQRQADHAMYQAKLKGKNRYHVFEEL